jgi:hypothetical protein
MIDDDHIDRVRKMHQGFMEVVELSFNCNELLVASLLAGYGLISNSSTTVIGISHHGTRDGYDVCMYLCV